jgi:hypothetical protein
VRRERTHFISIVEAIGATIWDMHYRTHQLVQRVADHCQRDIIILTSQAETAAISVLLVPVVADPWASWNSIEL